MSNTAEPQRLKVLTSREYNILKFAVDRIVPEAHEKYGLDLAQKIDSVLTIVRPELSRDLKLLLFVLEYGTPLFGFTFKRFTRMNSQEQDHYLSSWERSVVPFKRMGFQALKRSALAAFYGSDQSWSEIGYRGPWLERGYAYEYEGTEIQVPD